MDKARHARQAKRVASRVMYDMHYRYFEGFTNAVKRTMYVKDFFATDDV
jgi:hypothetical protein